MLLITDEDHLKQPEDELDECLDYLAVGDCIGGEDPFYVRLYCPESCQVYMLDEDYRPGVDRTTVIEG